jgi:hypothetical protein
MKRRGLTWLLVVAIGLLATGATALILLCRLADRRGMAIDLRNGISHVALTAMLEGLVISQQEVALPKGNIRDLYRWMTSNQHIMKYAWPKGPPAGITDFGIETFRDIWGHELVYRFPPRRRDVLFELYSVGRNGIDEGGEGDDVTCGKTVAFENPAVAGLFKDGIVDPEWFWQNLERLERDPETASIIGAPPERFRSPQSADPD